MTFKGKQWLCWICVTISSVFGYAAKQPVAPKSYDFRIHGSNTVGEKYAPLLVEGFFKSKGYLFIERLDSASAGEKTLVGSNPSENKEIRVDIHAHGSSTAFIDLLNRKTDIGMSSRKIKPEEVERLKQEYPSFAQLDRVEHVIAYDALAIMVNPENRVSSITLPQLAAVYAAKIDNWKQLGGADAPIVLLARDDNSGTYDTFRSLVLKPYNETLATAARRFESSRELAETVRQNPYAIGFVGVSHTGSNKLLAVAREAGSTGVVPDRFTVGTEDYPLSRKLYLYLPTENVTPVIEAFLNFATHEQGQKLAASADLISYYPIPVRPSMALLNLPRKYANLVMFGKRLSVIFRLDNGELDGKARRDIQRVVQYHQQNPNRRLVLAGFWDDPEFSVASQRKLQTWLDVLSNLLQQQGIETWQVTGGYLPIDEKQTEAGQKANRRIEVWVL